MPDRGSKLGMIEDWRLKVGLCVILLLVFCFFLVWVY